MNERLSHPFGVYPAVEPISIPMPCPAVEWVVRMPMIVAGFTGLVTWIAVAVGIYAAS